MLKIEKVSSFQVEDAKGGYCASLYSKKDAELVRELARGIPNLKCLDRPGERKGIYIFLKDPKTGEEFPEIEVYDPRLASRVRQNLHLFKGDL